MDVFLAQEGGFTSVATALALLLSLTLVFGAASAQWLLGRSAEIQEVADACSLASQNVVGAYSTVFQTVDACVLSLGLCGTLLYGAALISSAIPGLSAAAVGISDTARSVLDMRRSFAQSAEEGLAALESVLPAACMANSWVVVEQNEKGNLGYSGLAVPFPQESLSSFSLADDCTGEEMDAAADELREKSDQAKAQKDALDAAIMRGWLADCGAQPYCLWERAGHLASLSAGENPHYADPESWSFGAAILRARAYYDARLFHETAYGEDIESRVDSACRRRFYLYASSQLDAAYYHENADGSVDLYLPHLPRSAQEVRESELYTQAVWPATSEESGPTIHGIADCPGATGPALSDASLAAAEAGQLRECPVCRMGVGDMGKTVAASSTIDNGFEYWWAELVRASEDFERAADELAATNAEMRRIAEDGSSAFERALEALSVQRPKICPPGAWGSVAIVARSGGVLSPAGLAGAFSPQAELPPGAAVSAAVLAPDNSEDGRNFLAAFFDGLALEEYSPGGLAGRACALWGELLLGYGSSYEQLGGLANELFDGVGSLFGAKAASWLRSTLADLVERTGLAPADMRLRKPVLTNTQDVFAQAGYDHMAYLQNIIHELPEDGSPSQIARAVGRGYIASMDDPVLTIAELPIPGTDLTVPLTIDLRKVAEVL